MTITTPESPSRPTSVTIHDLPPELLLGIFSILVSLLTPVQDNRQLLYQVRSVCRVWRTLINTSRALWSAHPLYFHIQGRPPNTAEARRKIQLLHEHVPRMPIDLLIVDQSASLFDEFLPVYDTIKDDIVSLTIHIPAEGNTRALGFPLIRFPVMPNLQSVSLNSKLYVEVGAGVGAGAGSECRLNLCGSLKLTSFRSFGGYALGYLSGEVDTICRWDRITELCLSEKHMPLKTLFDILLRCHNLKSASLSATAHHPDALSHVTQPHKLAYLKEVRVWALGRYYHQIFDRLALPALTVFNINNDDHGPFDSTLGPIPLVQSLTGLRERSLFALEMFQYTRELFEPDAMLDFLASIPTLQYVSLHAACGLNARSVQLLAKPLVLPELTHFIYNATRYGRVLPDIKEEELVEFLRVRMRMKGMHFLCMEVSNELKNAESVRQVCEELALEGKYVGLTSR